MNYLGLLDKYISLIWQRLYSSCGYFELRVGITPYALSLLKKDNLIIKNDEVAFIDYREMLQTEEGIETLIVRGQMVTKYLARRIVWNTKTITQIEQGIRDLVIENAIDPDDQRRKISNLVLGQAKGFNKNIQKQVGHKNLLDEIKSIVIEDELGFSTTRNKENNLEFNVYKGIDRTSEQEENPSAIFSLEFDNVLTQEYTETNRNYKNVALIVGRGENPESATFGTATGLDRYELFVDGKDIDPKNLTTETYKQVLSDKGRAKLNEYLENYTFDARVDTESNLSYKKDFDLGDKVTVINKRWGIKLDARITEIKEIYETDGFKMEMVFGNGILSLAQKIKREVSV